MDQPSHDRIDLRDYLQILQTRKWTIIVVTLVSIAVSLALSARQTPIYQAEARIQLKSDNQAGYFPEAETEAQAITSAPVAALVKEDLGTSKSVNELIGEVAAQPLSPTSDVISVTYQSEDAEFARDAANSFVRNYIGYKSAELLGSIDLSRGAIENQITEVRRQIDRLSAQIEEARRNGQTDRVTSLESERGAQITQLGVLQTQLSEVSGTATQVTVGALLRPAAVPTDPVSPDHIKNGILGAFVGLLFGVGLAFLRERLDDRFKGRPDVERALQIPVLATVPRYSFGRRSEDAELPAATDPRSPASEAYRNLRTGLQFLATQNGARTFLVTSPSAHEGKTSTVANLGVALSQTGRRVVLVSADLRRPQLERIFGAQHEFGLSSWLLGEVDDVRNILLEHPDLPGLSVIPAGPIPSNPAELLTSPRIPELLRALESYFDFVLFDSPPVLPVADSVILASHLDGALLIFDAASTRRSAAVHAKEQIERVGGHVVGCVLNAFDPSTTPYYYEPYYYSNYYDGDSKDGAERDSSFMDAERRSAH